MAAFAVGSVLGGLAMIRIRFRRMLLAETLAVPVFSVLLFALAAPVSVPVVAGAAFAAGVCTEIFAVNWMTTMQQKSRQRCCRACRPTTSSAAWP
jgi:hypothetical protein